MNWNGLNINRQPYDSKEFKQVNIWLAGGDFGEVFSKYPRPFQKSETIIISVREVVTYCVKLQAESVLGDLSDFSETFCLTLLKQPKAPGAP